MIGNSWHVERNDLGLFSIPIEKGMVITATWPQYGSGLTLEQANLIAAAPHLLEACKAMVQALRDIRDSGSGLVYYHGDALDMGLQAIAKAERRTP